jgi:hypothetical protein
LRTLALIYYSWYDIFTAGWRNLIATAMLKLIEKVGEFLLGPEEADDNSTGKVELRELEVKFIKTQKQILHHIRLCKKSGGLIGVYSDVLGRGMFLTTVEDIEEDELGGTVIFFKPYDMSGRILQRSTVSLKEISALCPFNQMYVEPRVNDIGLRVLQKNMEA